LGAQAKGKPTKDEERAGFIQDADLWFWSRWNSDALFSQLYAALAPISMEIKCF
jgi:hypothetical protein